MLLGQVYQSLPSWKKLASINLRPKLAYRLMKYAKLVEAEHEIAEGQRVLIIRRITEVAKGADASIGANTPEMEEYAREFNEVLATEINLTPADISFGEVIEALDEKDEVLTVSDLAILEPFFDQYRNSDGSPVLSV